MNRCAFVFPGQGSQRPGMGRELARTQPQLLDRYYRIADEVVGFGLSALCWEGSKESLRDTAVTQPALFLTSLVTLEALRARGLRPDVVAGHSLGEYAALVAAGVLDWRDALRLVRLRGRLMADLNSRVAGTMVAILGLDLETVDRLCADVRDHTGELVEVANDNEPAQVVLAGHVSAVAEAVTAALAAGAVKAVSFPVGAPFHCGLMAPMAAPFARALDQVTFRDPVVDVVSTVTAEYVTSADEARGLLARQVTERVRWREAVGVIAATGVRDVVEVGPGRVLTGLTRRTVPGLRAHVTDATPAGCDATRELLRNATDVPIHASTDPGRVGPSRPGRVPVV